MTQFKTYRSEIGLRDAAQVAELTKTFRESIETLGLAKRRNPSEVRSIAYDLAVIIVRYRRRYTPNSRSVQGVEDALESIEKGIRKQTLNSFDVAELALHKNDAAELKRLRINKAASEGRHADLNFLQLQRQLVSFCYDHKITLWFSENKDGVRPSKGIILLNEIMKLATNRDIPAQTLARVAERIRPTLR